MAEPTTAIPDWASDATFSTGVESGVAPTLAMSAAEVAQGVRPGKWIARKANWFFRTVTQWLSYLRASCLNVVDGGSWTLGANATISDGGGSLFIDAAQDIGGSLLSTRGGYAALRSDTSLITAGGSGTIGGFNRFLVQSVSATGAMNHSLYTGSHTKGQWLYFYNAYSSSQTVQYYSHIAGGFIMITLSQYESLHLLCVESGSPGKWVCLYNGTGTF